MLLSFDAFEIDLATCELRRAGAPVPLQPRVFDTLRYLIEHRERVVGNQELIDALWGGQQLNELAVAWSVDPNLDLHSPMVGVHNHIPPIECQGSTGPVVLVPPISPVRVCPRPYARPPTRRGRGSWALLGDAE
jgi:hypothetical protein